MHLRFGASLVGDLAAAVVSVGAAVVTAGLLHPVLAPLVLLAALPQGWAGVRGAQLRMAANVRMNASLRRRFVTGDLLSERRERRRAAGVHHAGRRAGRAPADRRGPRPTTRCAWDCSRTA